MDIAWSGFVVAVVVGLAIGASSSALTNFLIIFLMNEYYSGRSFLSSFNAPRERKRKRTSVFNYPNYGLATICTSSQARPLLN